MPTQSDSRPNAPPDTNQDRAYPADKARQGEIILKTPLRRWIFFGGLIGFVLLAVLGGLLV